MPFERARTLLGLGAAQRRSKRKARARATLEQALAEFEELGRGDLGGPGPNGAREHRRARTLGERADPAETRVAALVAEGKTNREVAAALFVTDHTVEFHLSRIYRKLGVRSRAELARRFQG